MMARIALMSMLFSAGQTADSVTLVSFPGVRWVESNDPIMGGKSHGNWSVVGDHGVFQGSVVNVPGLDAPGFCRAVTLGLFSKDASAFLDGELQLTVRSTTPEYKGFKFAFGSMKVPKHHGGHELIGSYKSKLIIPADANGDWLTVPIKMSEFSWDWSDFSGDCDTKDPDGFQHQCCSDSADRCPSVDTLSGIRSFNIWAEGVVGDFYLEIKEVVATSSSSFIVV